MQQESICPENSIIIYTSKYACFAGSSECGFFRFTIQFLDFCKEMQCNAFWGYIQEKFSKRCTLGFTVLKWHLHASH